MKYILIFSLLFLIFSKNLRWKPLSKYKYKYNLFLKIFNLVNKQGKIKREMIEIYVDDRIPVCASAKVCFNDLCEIIDEEDYNYHLKYCYSLLFDCYKEMEEYPIPY